MVALAANPSRSRRRRSARHGVLYFNNFQAPLEGEWTPARTSSVGTGGEMVLGEFTGGESAVLSLANLPAHAALSLSYDLYLIEEDGGAVLQSAALSSDLSTAALTGLLPRPKGIAVDVVGGPNLMPLRGLDGTALDVAAVVPAGSPWPAGTTQPNLGNFGLGALPNFLVVAPSSEPTAVSLAALSTESSVIGGSYTVHHLQHTFKHTGDTLSIDFSSLPGQPSIGGGTWAIDNVALTHLADQMIRWEFEAGRADALPLGTEHPSRQPRLQR